jgi:dodecin
VRQALPVVVAATPHPSWNPFDETGRSGSTHREKCVVAQRPWTILHPPIAERDAMTNHTYRVIEIVGTSPDGIDAAIRNGLARAAETTRGLDWFEVQSVRGHLEDGPVAHFQVTLKVGFRLEDA